MRHPLVGTALVAAANIDVHPGVDYTRRCAAQYDFQPIGQSVIFVHVVVSLQGV